MIEYSKYLELKRGLLKLMADHPGKYLLRAIGDIYISLGDKHILKGMNTGNTKVWSNGEQYCYLGRELHKLSEEYAKRIK
jgi:hypothetical protein